MLKQRIQYIDALRGFTMILVVYCHVVGFGYHTWAVHFFSFDQILSQMRMPLFFFISGFILYKADRVWDLTTSLTFLWKKLRIQVFPTAFFFLLFCCIMNKSVERGLCESAKYGYWFTLMLFVFFLLYVSVQSCFSKCSQLRSWLPDTLLAGIGIALVILRIEYAHQFETGIGAILSLRSTAFFIYFWLGTIARRFFPYVEQQLDKGLWPMAAVMVFTVAAIAYFKPWVFAGKEYLSPVMGLCGIAMLFSLFRKHQEALSDKSVFGRVLQFIGRRTLDIYLLHFFFVPRHLMMVGQWFVKHPNPLLELALSMSISFVVIALCLFVSAVIRTSPQLGKALFGASHRS